MPPEAGKWSRIIANTVVGRADGIPPETENGLASLQGRFRDGFHIFASLQRRFLLGGAELVDGTLPELVLQADFLGALAHADEALVVRRVRSTGSRAIAGRPRDGDDINLNRDVHSYMDLLG